MAIMKLRSLTKRVCGSRPRKLAKSIWISSNMMRSITYIKTVHTLIFIFMIIWVGIIFFTLLLEKISHLTWIGIGFILLEGLVLLVNGWKCPLTVYAENLGADDGSATDIFLPKFIANQMFKIFGTISMICFMMLLVRLLT